MDRKKEEEMMSLANELQILPSDVSKAVLQTLMKIESAINTLLLLSYLAKREGIQGEATKAIKVLSMVLDDAHSELCCVLGDILDAAEEKWGYYDKSGDRKPEVEIAAIDHKRHMHAKEEMIRHGYTVDWYGYDLTKEPTLDTSPTANG